MPEYRIVDTDNYGGDYPDEKFVGPPFSDKGLAEDAAAEMNIHDFNPRYYKVVQMPYELQPGFEP